MTNPSAPLDGLTIVRADFAQALRIVSGQMGRRISGASLQFKDGWLFIGAGKTLARAPAQGVWPLTITVDSIWVKRLARSLPPGNPVFLHVEDGRLYANKYSEPCGSTTAEAPLRPSVGSRDVGRRILEAATILKPFLVGREDLIQLVEVARKRGPASWRQNQETLISAVSKAWEFLAPLGVETSDLRSLVDCAVRDAWKVKKDK